jgi:AraC-like DNA-binding protein
MPLSASASYVKAILDYAVARGADASALTSVLSENFAADFDRDARVSLDEVKILVEVAKDLLDDPAFALRFGAESDFTDMSIVGLITQTAETMGEAFHQLNRFAKLVVEVEGHDLRPRFEIVRADGKTWLEDHRLNPNLFPELTESTWARFISQTARYFGNAPFAKSVLVTHCEPKHAEIYSAIYRVPITFGADRNAIEIDPSWLDIKLHKPNRYVFGIFSDKAQQLLESLALKRTMSAKVEACVIPNLHKGNISMERVAAALGVSKSSLYRSLKGEGGNFESLIDSLRHRMALHYVGAAKISVKETAYLVGFSDPASFSRAFKRWTDQSPNGYNATLRDMQVQKKVGVGKP